MPARKQPTAYEKIATLLLMYWDGKGEPVPFEIAKQMTAHQICSLVQWHHSPPYTWEPSNHPTRLTPMPVPAHRKRTATVDIPTVAKVKRATRRDQGRERILAKAGYAAPDGYEPPALVPPRRPKRRFRGWRRFNGEVVWNEKWGR